MAQVLRRSEHLLPDWALAIQSELDLVECRLESAITTDVPAALELSIRLLSAGGKRVRPALTLLSALACGGRDTERAINLAAAMELIHMASLVHDDVVDQRIERRGAPTANSTCGNKLSVLVGDFLISKALSLIAADGDVEVLRVISATVVKMTESEVLQLACEGSFTLWQANYDRIILDKTARLMAACCECGAVVAGANDATRSALWDYGKQVGLAFQIADDVLDITGDPACTGKEIGADLVSGKFTLPVLITARKNLAVADILRKDMVTERDAALAAEMVVACGADSEALDVAAQHTAIARKQLEILPGSAYRTALETLASFVVRRSN